MRLLAACLLLFCTLGQAAKPEACVSTCDQDFHRCDARAPGANPQRCYDTRQLCVDRCDPSRISQATHRARQRSAEDLRADLRKHTEREKCVQRCEKNAATCQQANESHSMCTHARDNCIKRCDGPQKRQPPRRK